MFGFARAPKTAPLPRQARPRLEVLEDRWVPATVSISDVTYGTGKTVTVTGTLSHTQQVANQVITLSGVLTGSAVTNADGNFTMTGDATQLGTLMATAADGSSNVAYWSLTDQAPELLTFTAVEGEVDCWTFSGTAKYFRSFDTLRINMGGVPASFANGRTAWSNNTGAFSFQITLNATPSDNGLVWAKAESPWGTLSSMLTVYVNQTGT